MSGRCARMVAGVVLVAASSSFAAYTNFESSHVHPVALTPSGARLLAVNTPDGLLEVFAVGPQGDLVPEAAIPVGLEPVSVAVRSETEAWVVNNLSDSISVVDLTTASTVETLFPGDEPSDVAFANGKAFVAVSQEDRIRVYTDLVSPPDTIDLDGRDVRALAVSEDGASVYAVVMRSGNRTAALGVEATFPGGPSLGLDPDRLNAMGLIDIGCDGPTPPYPPLPAGVTRNPALTDPPDGVPKVGLIVGWDAPSSSWRDEAGTDWTHCLPFRPADHDLFVVDAATHAVTTVDGLGTSLFEVSVQPGTGKVWVPHTDARNLVRFEHPLGVQGHVVDNRVAIVDPGNANAVSLIDLNAHIDRASDPTANLAERQASISQPGMMAWNADGSVGYLTAIGSHKLFRVDGTCGTPACIFGPSRAAPNAVEVGEGPTGVALAETLDRLYVLNRISHSLTIVQASTLTVLEEIPLHDPSSPATREGRRFLYDAVALSAHGDAACSSCHLSGDHDGLSWDLGNPAGSFVPYSTLFDNVRFIQPFLPISCDPPTTPGCAAHDGFDPQKGPMATQTLRGMLEPLHWRGDRSTMNAFNAAFVDLLGSVDVGPIDGHPAGLSPPDMESYRQFALAIRNPPNPFRTVDDQTPCGPRASDPTCEVQPHGALLPGNPTEGALLFDSHPSDGGLPCVSCHAHPFGAQGGALGGVTPTEPVSAQATALFNGDLDGSPHSDLEVPHLRNMYDKIGPVYAAPGAAGLPESKPGIGFIHDGSFPDLYRFFSADVFDLSAADEAQQVRDITAFMFYFPTETRPAIGRQVTVPPGAPPTGSAGEEALLATLVGLGDAANAGRHCELVVSARTGGFMRYARLEGAAWLVDQSGAAPLTTTQVREAAQGPLTFTCVPVGEGERAGGNRDEDPELNFDDCAPGDPATWGPPVTVSDLALAEGAGTRLSFSPQAATIGPSVGYEIWSGAIADLESPGFGGAACLGEAGASGQFAVPGPDPIPGTGAWFLVKASNPCGVADMGDGREILETLDCR